MVIKEILDEWDYELNGDPDGYADHSNKKVWWICRSDQQHKWKASIHNRVKTKCPYCSGRIVTHLNSLSNYPEIVKQIHPKNGSIDFEKIARFSHKKLWWKCSNGHEWKAEVASRVSGQGCPFCNGRRPTLNNNLAVVFPEIAKEWGVKNLNKPEEFTPFSKTKVWWRCLNGHEWQTSIANRTLSGSGCYICSGYSNQKKCEESIDGLSKRCNICCEMKLKSEFRYRRGEWVNSVCKSCESKNILSYRTMTKEGVVAEILRRKRHYCQRNNLEFDLTKKYLLDRLESNNWCCELTNIPLRAIKTTLDEKYQGFHLDSISIDRINHKGGYTKDNIRVILNQVNIFRSNGSDEKMYEIAKALLDNRK
jgi:hypothetical protein